MPRALRPLGPYGGPREVAVSYERGTPVVQDEPALGSRVPPPKPSEANVGISLANTEETPPPGPS